MTKKRNKVLLIGWDAADWKVIFPLIEQGKMPTLASLINRGVYGRLQTLDPPLSPMLWTSIATGMRADKHRIGGFIEPTPNGDGLRPVTSTSRKVKAIWNILNQEGYKSNVVAWWPSNPAEPINGVMVSNLYQVAKKSLTENWEMPSGTVHPESLSEVMKEFRIHPQEITLAMAHPFVPNIATDLELRKEKRTFGILKTIANAATVHAASTYLQTEHEWDFMAVYHDAIDHFSHLAMRYFPPRRPQIDEKEFNDFKDVVEAAYRFHDMMLERTLELIDDNTTVILISDHGFHSDEQRPLKIPHEPSGPAIEHSPYGIFVMAGAGIRTGGKQIAGASVLDITPTILHYLDLPVGKDMDGKVLLPCFENPKPIKFIDSWEQIEGNSGMHNEMLREDPWAAQEALQQLVELGYIEELDDDKLNQVERAKRENKYYIARNLLNGKKVNEAIEMLLEIYNESKILRYGQRLAFAYLSKKMYRRCADLIQELKQIAHEDQVKFYQNKLKDKDSDVFKNIEFEEPMYLEFIEGLLLLAINKPQDALPILEKVQQKNQNNLQVALQIAQILNQRKRYSESEIQFNKALEIDSKSQHAHYGLGISYLRRGNNDMAIEHFLSAIDLDFYMPNAHFYLGQALFKKELYEDATSAFEVAVRLKPGMTKAHKWLLEIYKTKLRNEEKLNFTLNFLKNNIVGEITLITGIDNCDWTVVESVLLKYNIPFCFDALTRDKVTNLHIRNTFLHDYSGKAIHVPNHLLSALPTNFTYRVIYLNSDLMNRNIRSENQTIHLKEIEKYQRQREKIETWISSQAGLKVFYSNDFLSEIEQVDFEEFMNEN
jgi:predicted AlkP superfamily phosphohydrolase/phosphomutase/tetratricopeptide (TPR) repeat protein